MNESLVTLVQAAKEVGGAAWPILVKSVWTEALIDVLGFGLCLFPGALGLIVAGYKIGTRSWLRSLDEDAVGFAALGCVVIGTISVVIAIMGFWSSLPGLIYPEGEAMQQLPAMVKR